ncbi:rhomboid-like protein 2 [Quercus suber]|uniref:Rhomboid-like protein 2 n=1 Tax=Quercus suber TaxID=58331 RepID=A0AAW0JJU8_QUESU
MWTIKLILKDTCQDFPLALICKPQINSSRYEIKQKSRHKILAVYASYCWLLKLANLLIFKPFLLCSWPGSLNIRFVRVGDLTITSQPTIEQQADSWNLVQKGFIALYANFDEEYLCLIPKSPFYLEGAGGELGNKLGQDVTLEAFSYMMTCEINNITWHHPMVSELLANWIIFAKKCAELVTPVRIIAINCPLRFLPRVNNLAQFEGFLSRFPLGFILLIRPQFGYEPMSFNIPTIKP